eukprot:SAG31_NODE_1480_length_8180_cov_5.458978_4_plen_305_part_00
MNPCSCMVACRCTHIDLMFAGWDHSVALLGVQSERFFGVYRDAGGLLDEIILDTEIDSCLDDDGCLYNDPTMPPAWATHQIWRSCLAARWSAIQHDPRFPAVVSRLIEAGASGFSTANWSDPNALSKLLPFRKTGLATSLSQDALTWNAVMKERGADYWSTAFVQPARKHFPKVMASNYRYRKWTSKLCVPDSQFGVMVCNSKLSGAVVGGDSNGYSTQNLYNSDPNAAGAATLKHFFGVTDYDWSPFNQLRFAVLTVRGMVLGGKKASIDGDVPVKPWGKFAFFRLRSIHSGSTSSFVAQSEN